MNNDSNEENRMNRIRARRGELPQKQQAQPSVFLQTRRSSDLDPKRESIANARRKGQNGINARWVSGGLTFLLGLSIAAFSFMPEFRVKEAEINGLKNINMEEIKYYAGINGKPIYMIDPAAMEANLIHRYPEIREGVVSIALPNRVRIDLVQRLSLILWDFGGTQYWIDEDGKVLSEGITDESTLHVMADSFPGARSREDRDLPDVFGQNMLRSAIAIGKHMPEGKQLYFTYDNGYGWDTDDGWRIFWGKNDTDLEEKLRMAEELTAFLKRKEISPVILSLEFKDAPYYRFME